MTYSAHGRPLTAGTQSLIRIMARRDPSSLARLLGHLLAEDTSEADNDAAATGTHTTCQSQRRNRRC